MEVFPKIIRAFDKNCYGCKKHGKFVMITVQDDNNKFQDIFLNQNMALEFALELLNITLLRNFDN